MVESDPENKVDFGGAMFSEATDELVGTSYYYDREKRLFRDKHFAADYKWLEKQLPGMEISMGSRTRDEQVWLVTASSDTEPGQTLLFDRKTHKLTPQYKVREKLPRQDLAEMTVGDVHVVGWAGDSGVSDAAEGGGCEESAGAGDSARRAVGARCVGL